jgi:hypothetical protein
MVLEDENAEAVVERRLGHRRLRGGVGGGSSEQHQGKGTSQEGPWGRHETIMLRALGPGNRGARDTNPETEV